MYSERYSLRGRQAHGRWSARRRASAWRALFLLKSKRNIEQEKGKGGYGISLGTQKTHGADWVSGPPLVAMYSERDSLQSMRTRRTERAKRAHRKRRHGRRC